MPQQPVDSTEFGWSQAAPQVIVGDHGYFWVRGLFPRNRAAVPSRLLAEACAGARACRESSNNSQDRSGQRETERRLAPERWSGVVS